MSRTSCIAALDLSALTDWTLTVRILNRVPPPQLLLLDGSTGAGKSLLLRYLREEYSKSVFVGKKFTTRKKRLGDSDWEFSFLPTIPDRHSSYSFQSVDNNYAVNIEEARYAVANGFTYVISCTDRPVTEKLRSEFGTLVVYVYRTLTSSDLEMIFNSRGLFASKESELRRDEVSSVAVRYLQQLEIYDHVVLNISSELSAKAQLSTILSLYRIEQDSQLILGKETL